MCMLADRIGRRYLLVTASNGCGLFLANNGSYSVDGGLLLQPESSYAAASSCGEPVAGFQLLPPPPRPAAEGGSWVLRRRYQRGVIEVDLGARTAAIRCGSAASAATAAATPIAAATTATTTATAATATAAIAEDVAAAPVEPRYDYDVVVYGSTPAGIAAATAAGQLGS